jgi:hypothetical protein
VTTHFRACLDAILQGILLILSGVAGLCVPGRSNCVLFALGRVREAGQGAVVFVPSQYGWWFHAYYALYDITDPLLEYVPESRKRRRLIPPLLFRGQPRYR